MLVFSPSTDFDRVFHSAQDEIEVKFSSPDETANYFWIKQLATNKPLYYFEELNGVGNNLVRPRSINTVEGKNVPGSFLGMIFIYGFVAKIFGLKIIPFLTPFFAALGILFFYLLIKQIFQRKTIALISAILLSFTPAYFYYAARGMYHNLLFVALLIIGLYILLKGLAGKAILKSEIENPQSEINSKSKIKNSKIVKLLNCKIISSCPQLTAYSLSGLIIGLAIITRTSEIFWIAITVLLIFIFNFKKIYWPGLILFIGGLWLAAIGVFYQNQILYGQLISVGYRSVITDTGLSQAVRSGVLFQILISPFGFNLKSIFINGFNYLYRFLPLWSFTAIMGGFLFAILPIHFIKISYKKRFLYLVYCLLLTIYLLIFYGSWSIVDRIDQKTLSLGTSYLRYWMPIYILALPLIASLISQFLNFAICNKLKFHRRYKTALGLAVIILLFIPTVNLVVRKTDESLFLLKNLSENRIKSKLTNQIVNPEDVIIIYKQADKIFFPERPKIITELVVPIDYRSVANIAKLRQVYYYTFAPSETVNFISRRDFEPYGLKITDGQQVLGTDWIYKIEIIN